MISVLHAGGSRWALRSRQVAVPHDPRPATIIIDDETIAVVEDHAADFESIPVVDVGDRLVLPGLVDSHVHINDPGRSHWEGFATATHAAAAGGITTLIDMPLNSDPVTTSLAALRVKQAAARGKLSVDCGFHGGVVPGNAHEIQSLIDAGVCAFKAFLCHSGIDGFPAATETDLRDVMPVLAAAGLPLFVHAELVGPLPAEVEEQFAANPRSYAHWVAMRPAAWEVEAILMMIRLARETGCAVHIVHLSAAEEALPLIVAAKKDGVPITVETCPHYLTFAAEEIPDADPRFKCAPPIRERRQRDRLRRALASGEIDTVGTDHSPAPPELKCLETGDLKSAWGGIASLQFLLPVLREWNCWDAVTSKPAALVGIGARKGAIAAGRDADFAIVDADAEFVATPDSLRHRHRWSPYVGKTLRGVVETTILRGRAIFHHGELIGEPRGQLLERPRA